jgi:hypothetical protein
VVSLNFLYFSLEKMAQGYVAKEFEDLADRRLHKSRGYRMILDLSHGVGLRLQDFIHPPSVNEAPTPQ